MDLFKSKSTLIEEHKAELEASNTLNSEMQSQLDAAKEEARVSSESNASLTAQLAEATSEIAGLEANAKTLTDELATANKSLEDSEAKQAGFDEKVEAAAVIKVGASGHAEPLADVSSDADEDLESAIKAMNEAKTGAERHTASLKVTELRNK